MHGWVWLLPAHETTHYDWRGEAYAQVAAYFSEKEPLWTLSWNPTWPTTKPGYALRIYHGWGRHIGFWGHWSLSQIAREIEALWTQEGFQPTAFQPSPSQLGSFLAKRWKKRFSLQVYSPFPPASEKIARLPVDEAPLSPVSSRIVTLLTGQEDPAESTHIAELLALEGYTVWVVGSPPSITRLRQASYRFPSRLHLKVGLPWAQTAVYLTRASLLLCTDSACPEAPFLEAGPPWIVPHDHPYASAAAGTFSSLNELSALVARLLSTP
ncbi:MAG: hypothetical protein KatS3mg026_0668 [Bacteroidia bacterium]|nr:MAG: hypothetical protein KatS3mg026_0668 [Bacteroidia bacterium]